MKQTLKRFWFIPLLASLITIKDSVDNNVKKENSSLLYKSKSTTQHKATIDTITDIELFFSMIQYYYSNAINFPEKNPKIINTDENLFKLKCYVVDWGYCVIEQKYDLAFQNIDEAFKEIKKEEVKKEYYDVILYLLKAITYEKNQDYAEAIKYYHIVNEKARGYGWSTGKKLSEDKLKRLSTK